VVAGIGNGFDGIEGWVGEVGAGVVVGTYLHGPVLPQNPVLADWLITRALGVELEPLDPEPAAELVAARRRQLSL
jgi:CobQ-like glutamine amidotransferase family enzyme